MAFNLASLLHTRIVRHEQRICLLDPEMRSQAINHRDRRRTLTNGLAMESLEGRNSTFLLTRRHPRRKDLDYDPDATLTLQSIAEQLSRKKKEDVGNAIAESERPGIEEIKGEDQALLPRGPRSQTSSLTSLIP